MAIRNCLEQRLARESSVFLDQHVRAHDLETSFIRIEFDAQPLFARSIVYTQSNIRMRIVASSSRQLAVAFSDRFIPSLQVFRWPSEKVCKHQLRIAPIRPKTVKEQYDWVRGEGICE